MKISQSSHSKEYQTRNVFYVTSWRECFSPYQECSMPSLKIVLFTMSLRGVECRFSHDSRISRVCLVVDTGGESTKKNIYMSEDISLACLSRVTRATFLRSLKAILLKNIVGGCSAPCACRYVSNQRTGKKNTHSKDKNVSRSQRNGQ